MEIYTLLGMPYPQSAVPQWVIDAYEEPQLKKKWKRKLALLIFKLSLISFTLFVLSSMFFLIAAGSIFRHPADIPMYLQICWFSCGLLSVVSFFFSVFIIDAEYKKLTPFRDDWSALQEKLGSGLDPMSQKNTAVAAYEYLIGIATWLRIYEITKDERQNIEREKLRTDYRLFVKFGLVPPLENPDKPEDLPLHPIFVDAEPEVKVKLRDALEELLGRCLPI